MTTQSTPQPQHITLVVDDDLPTLQVFRTRLERLGYAVLTASDGETALKLFTESHPDILLLDALMPGLNGYEVCARIRAMESGHSIPIIMVTVHDDPPSLTSAFEAGASDYVTKPVSAQTWIILNQRMQYMVRLKRAEQHARDESEFSGLVLNSIHSAVIVFDREGRIVTCNQRALAFVEGTLADIRGRHLREVLRSPLEADRIERRLKAIIEGGEQSSGEYEWQAPDQPRRVLDWSCRLHRATNGSAKYVVMTAEDITHEREMAEQLAVQAAHDPLTGLLNRFALNSHIEAALSTAFAQGLGCAFLYLDLDRFRDINNAFGHALGDACLVELARRFEVLLQGGDKIARIGGDEFLVIRAEIASPEVAITLAEALLAAVRRPFILNENETYLTASIGISFATEPGQSPTTLIQRADLALNEAKLRGKDIYLAFEPSIENRAAEKIRLNTDLRSAIDHGELQIHYQPQVDLTNGQISGVEALIRWWHPSLGQISPASFIASAEESGLIVRLGNWVLSEAATAMNMLRRGKQKALQLAVNVSALQFERANFVSGVRETLEAIGMEAASLELEITESLLLRNPTQTIQKLHELRALGIKIAIDDFGSGYSSLNYLRQFPVDTLKIDRAFVEGLSGNVLDASKSLAILEAIIQLAHVLSVRVVVEGIETESQTKLLKAIGCDVGQGYYWGGPMTIEMLQTRLKRA